MITVRTDIIVPVSSLLSHPPEFSSSREFLGVVVVVVALIFFFVVLKVKTSGPWSPP